jgi:hypothetical protein
VQQNGDGPVILPLWSRRYLNRPGLEKTLPYDATSEAEQVYIRVCRPNLPAYLSRDLKLSLRKYQISSSTKLERRVINHCMTPHLTELDALLNTTVQKLLFHNKSQRLTF